MKLSKYVLSLSLLTAATATYAVPATVANAATKTMSGVISKDVIVRAASTPNSKNLGTLKKGAKVTIYKETTYWYQVKFKNKLSYVSKDHVKLSKKPTTAKPKPNTDQVVSTIKSSKKANAEIKSNVYFYAKASTSSKKLGTLKKGTKIHMNNVSQFGWVEFDNDGKKNYVYKDFVTKISKPTAKPGTSKPKPETSKPAVNENEKTSYKPNFSKTFSFKSEGHNGTLVYSKKKTASGYAIWSKKVGNKTSKLYIKEAKDGVYYATNSKDAVRVLPYSFKVGQTYKNGKSTFKVTGANKTVKTTAGTFKSVATVTGNGYTFYVAPGAGIVKMTKGKKTTFELSKVK